MSDTPLDAVISVDTLVQWIDTLDAIVDEARIHVSEAEWRAFPVDPANIAMVKQSLSAEAFEAYYAEDITLGLNLETFRNYVTAGDSDIVSLEYDAVKGKLHIQSGRASFDMALIDPESIRNDGDISDSVWEGINADVELDAAALAHGISIGGMVSDTIEVQTDPDAEDPIAIAAEGDSDDASVGYSDSLHEGSSVDASGSSMFSHDYMDKLTSEIPKTNTVRVRAGDDWPVILNYEHADGASEVTALCAPRMPRN